MSNSIRPTCLPVPTRRDVLLDTIADAFYDIAAAAVSDQLGDPDTADRYLCAARDRLATIPTAADVLWLSALLIEVPA